MSTLYAAVEYKDIYNRLFEFSFEKHNLFANPDKKYCCLNLHSAGYEIIGYMLCVYFTACGRTLVIFVLRLL